MHLHGGVDTPGAIWKVLFITALCQLSFYYHDLYDLTVVNSRRELLVRLLQASGAASLLLAALYLAFPALIIGHGVLASSVLFFVLAIVLWRLLFLQVGRARGLQEHVLIVGTSRSARMVAREVLDQHDYAYRIVGFIDDDPAMIGRSIVNPKVIGTPADIVRLVRERRIDRIIVGLVRSAGQAADRGAARGEAAGRAHRGARDDVRAADRKDHARRAASELADLLGRLPRAQADARRQARDGHRAVARRHAARRADDGR